MPPADERTCASPSSLSYMLNQDDDSAGLPDSRVTPAAARWSTDTKQPRSSPSSASICAAQMRPLWNSDVTIFPSGYASAAWSIALPSSSAERRALRDASPKNGEARAYALALRFGLACDARGRSAGAGPVPRRCGDRNTRTGPRTRPIRFSPSLAADCVGGSGRGVRAQSGRRRRRRSVRHQARTAWRVRMGTDAKQ